MRKVTARVQVHSVVQAKDWLLVSLPERAFIVIWTLANDGDGRSMKQLQMTTLTATLPPSLQARPSHLEPTTSQRLDTYNCYP